MKSLSFSLFSSIPLLFILSIPLMSNLHFRTIHLQHRPRKMCDSSRFLLLRSYLGFRHRRRPLRFHRSMRFAKDRASVKAEMEIEIENLKLFMENQSIIEENERLRNKAFLLHKENQVLQSQLQCFSEQKSQSNLQLEQRN